ncbi:MAG: squalene cyclase [Acidimicrobiia bacterium]|nr:squalene cyclase [Acidimicrobiia bacterium]
MSVIAWLLDSDPAIRWQVLDGIQGRPEGEWGPVRAAIETEGWGARLLDLEDSDGSWAGGAHFPGDFTEEDWRAMAVNGQPWTATSHSLTQLREFGLLPTTQRARDMVRLIGENCRWDHASERYWEGEVEPCINGMTVANGAYFGVDVSAIVDRLLEERLADGGWNCEAENGSLRTSFDTTINVLEGLREFDRATGGSTATRDARRGAEEYLLERELFRRLTTGEPADPDYLLLRNPWRWQYDVLRGVDYFRSTAADPDPRLGAALDHVASRRRSDGKWALAKTPKGKAWFDVDDGPGEPSRWVTLRALRALRWAGREDD